MPTSYARVAKKFHTVPAATEFIKLTQESAHALNFSFERAGEIVELGGKKIAAGFLSWWMCRQSL